MKLTGFELLYETAKKKVGPTKARQVVVGATNIVLSKMQQDGSIISTLEIDRRLQDFVEDFIKDPDEVS